MSDSDFVVLTEGGPLPSPMYDVPGLTWVNPTTLVLILPEDADEEIAAVIDADRLLLALGLAGSTPVMNILAPDEDGDVHLFVQAPNAWTSNKPEPVFPVPSGEPTVWTIVLSLGGPGFERQAPEDLADLRIVRLLLFQTPEIVTEAMREIVAVQVQAGPITVAQRNKEVGDYYESSNGPQEVLDTAVFASWAARMH